LIYRCIDLSLDRSIDLLKTVQSSQKDWSPDADTMLSIDR
jgi:hypothetical protein